MTFIIKKYVLKLFLFHFVNFDLEEKTIIIKIHKTNVVSKISRSCLYDFYT